MSAGRDVDGDRLRWLLSGHTTASLLAAGDKQPALTWQDRCISELGNFYRTQKNGRAVIDAHMARDVAGEDARGDTP